MSRRNLICSLTTLALLAASPSAEAQRTVKPVLHGKHWVAITGKPLAATAGAVTFARGGNAVDAACAMLAATSTMWDGKGFMEVEVAYVRTNGCGVGQPYLGIHIGTIHIYLTAMIVDQLGYVANGGLKNPMGRGVGNH